MKKPINGFALILWTLAAVFLLADVPLALRIRQLSADTAAQYGRPLVDQLTLTNTWEALHAALFGTGILLALGVITELLDQIRWNALPEEKRSPRRWL